MAQGQLRIVDLADALAEVLPAVKAQCDALVYGTLRDIAIRAEEDAGVVIYALSLFRADKRSRRTVARRDDLRQTYGADVMPRAPWEDGDPREAA
jgi:hypothetical protein